MKVVIMAILFYFLHEKNKHLYMEIENNEIKTGKVGATNHPPLEDCG